MEDHEPFSEHRITRTKKPERVRDDVRRILGEHGLEVRGRRAEFDARFNAVRLGSVTVSFLRYGCEVSLTVDSLPGYHLNYPLTGVVETEFRGRSVSAVPGRGCFYPPDEPETQVWAPQTAQICLKFDRSALEREFQNLLGRAWSGTIRFAEAVDLTTPESQGFLAAINVCERECARPSGMVAHPLAVRHLEYLLLDSVLFAHPHNFSEILHQPTKAAAPKAVRLAVDLIEGHPETPMTVTDLARHAGVSVRSLQLGFREHIGVSPMAFLRDIRLTRVHDELLQAPAGTTTVTDAAYRWGFAHLGRFTRDYHRKFGQKPSETLRISEG